jgi:hypothetical protein
MFENKVLKRIFGVNMDEVTREWKKWQNEKLHMYHSPHTIRVIKSKRMRWEGRVRGEARCIQGFSAET